MTLRDAHIDRSGETIVRADGVDLCVETFGDPADPAILLIAGAAASMDWWEDEFCLRLAAGRRFVVRYDLRDTGRSVSYPPGSPSYTQPDLVDDAIGLLDALGVDRAHVVGLSFGGGLGQRMALDHPARVATLTLMSTSPGGPGGPDNPDLPPMSAALAASFAEAASDPEWTDREAVIQQFVDGERLFESSELFDEARVREIAARVVDRTTDIAASMTNHWIVDGGEPLRHRLGEITAPTLVLHGAVDPLFPIGHGEALAAEIAGARLVPLPGVGHQFPPPAVWDVVVPAIVDHTSGRPEE